MAEDMLLALLRSVDTPTVCDAIEIVQGKRGFSAHTTGSLFATEPDAAPIVGYACTAKIAARFPSAETAQSMRERRVSYYRHVARAPKPGIMVVEDIDQPVCSGAFWGRVNANIHKGFGMAGVVTNGAARNLGDLPDGFPILAGGTGASHAFSHVTGFGLPVTVFGLKVGQGDLVHADRHGAAVIPRDVAPRLRAAIRALLAAENTVIEATRAEDFDWAAFEEAWSSFESARPTR